MSQTTTIIIFASLGFILMGTVMLKNQKLEKILDSSNLYSDTRKYIKFNGQFNIVLGVIGAILAFVNYILPTDSNYVVIIFISIILIATVVQKIIGKKYKK
ncbi:MAG: hypothetical protein ACRDA5_13670 [Clostridium sp.]